MSKRLFFLIAVLMIAISTVAQAQEPKPVFVLTEQQINDEFAIPSTTAYTISNLVVDVKPGEIHVAYTLTDIRDGTSNTLGIIAILIGLVQGDTHEIAVRDVIISGVDAPPRLQREIGQLTLRAWRGYERSALAAAGITTIGRRLMEEEGIFF